MRVELSRGEVIESAHQVDVVIATASGPVVAWGSVEQPVIPRSAIKFIQALPLLHTGAAERFGVSDVELALACSSHSGEPAHVAAVEAWLQRIGCSMDDLECGPSVPIGEQAAVEHHRARADATPILNCCSGKHAGFLTVARHLGTDTGGYIQPDHPVQEFVTAAITELTGHDLAAQRPGQDGCGIPTFAVPLSGLATAMAKLVSPDELPPEYREAARRLITVPEGRQFWVSGTGRHEVVLGEAIDEPVVAKIGAEGVFMVGLPDRGLGIALKARDGAGRACEAAISATLAWLGVLSEHQDQELTNKAGTPVGHRTVIVDEPALNLLS